MRSLPFSGLILDDLTIICGEYRLERQIVLYWHNARCCQCSPSSYRQNSSNYPSCPFHSSCICSSDEVPSCQSNTYQNSYAWLKEAYGETWQIVCYKVIRFISYSDVSITVLWVCFSTIRVSCRYMLYTPFAKSYFLSIVVRFCSV